LKKPKIYDIILLESEGSEMDKRELKKSPEELTQYLQFKRRGSIVPAKKGRGSVYKRNPKYKNREEDSNVR
jgi:hypothetical protein